MKNPKTVKYELNPKQVYEKNKAEREASALANGFDDFAIQTLNKLGADYFTYVNKTLENMNEDDGSDGFEQVTAAGYNFIYRPDNLKVLVAVTDYDYMVALVDDNGSFIENDHSNHCADIPELFKELHTLYKSAESEGKNHG